jgi:hypothetical protein
MFIQATNVIKQRLIREIRSRIAEHPDFSDVLVSNKMPFRDPPSKAIIITNASGSNKRLSMDDFIRDETARASLARTVEHPSLAIEWVVDNPEVPYDEIADPGFYFTRILSVPTYNDPGQYQITPVIKKQDRFSGDATNPLVVAELSEIPLESRLRVFVEVDGEYYRSLVSPANYVYDNVDNEVVLSDPIDSTRQELVVEYYYAADVIGPINFMKNQSDVESINGVVLAFGERIVPDDEQVVVVGAVGDQVCYKVYGGQWDISLDIQCFAQDPGMQERLADYVSIWLWERREDLENDHVIIEDISLGGENTDLEVEVSTVPYFSASLGLQIKTNWEIRIPVTFTWRALDIYDFSLDDGTLTDLEASNIPTTVIAVYPLEQDGFRSIISDVRVRMISPGFLAL